MLLIDRRRDFLQFVADSFYTDKLCGTIFMCKFSCICKNGKFAFSVTLYITHALHFN